MTNKPEEENLLHILASFNPKGVLSRDISRIKNHVKALKENEYLGEIYTPVHESSLDVVKMYLTAIDLECACLYAEDSTAEILMLKIIKKEIAV